MGFLRDPDFIYTVLGGVIVSLVGFAAKFILKYFRNRKNKIGCFEMAYRNIGVDYWNPKGPLYAFDLINSVPFRNLGEDKIILEKIIITINGNITNKKTYHESNVYQNGEFASTKNINFNLSDFDKTESKLLVEIKFHAINSKKYKYTQTLTATFWRDERYKLWNSDKPDSNVKKRWY